MILNICALLAAITWVVFSKTLGYPFVTYDDPQYVYENAKVAAGLSPGGIFWGFTHTVGGNWHPLTVISHMLDCQLFGLKPAGHHFINVFLHTTAVILLFVVLRAMTRTFWQSVFVAALFAIHPLHVESVAWISERKDVLSAVFFMLTLGAYVRYVRTRSLTWLLPRTARVRVGSDVQADAGDCAVHSLVTGLLAIKAIRTRASSRAPPEAKS